MNKPLDQLTKTELIALLGVREKELESRDQLLESKDELIKSKALKIKSPPIRNLMDFKVI